MIKMKSQNREEVMTLLRKALVNLEWKEDESALKNVENAYIFMKENL